MSDFGDYYYDPDVESFAEEFDFRDDDTAMEYFSIGFMTSSDEDSDWFDASISADDRAEAREAFFDWIEENYDDFDWEAFWEEWEELYG